MAGVVAGKVNGLSMLLMWVLYTSIRAVGQRWYSYGWESQLLETSFLAVRLLPVWSTAPLPPGTPPPRSIIVLYTWLIFRIMLGAGLIKIRGDACWRVRP